MSKVPRFPESAGFAIGKRILSFAKHGYDLYRIELEGDEDLYLRASRIDEYDEEIDIVFYEDLELRELLGFGLIKEDTYQIMKEERDLLWDRESKEYRYKEYLKLKKEFESEEA